MDHADNIKSVVRASTFEPQQVAADLRTVVVRRVGSGQKVAVLSSDVELVRLLRENGNSVLVDPENHEALTQFSPQVVLAFDGLASGGQSGFERLREAVPSASLVFSFAQAASANVLLSQLIGRAVESSLAAPVVEGWIYAAGYAVESRDAIVEQTQLDGLALDAQVNLRQLLEQFNPLAACDRLVFTCLPVAKSSVSASFEQGLTSMVLVPGSVPTLEAIKGLCRLSLRPLEVVVVGESTQRLAVDEASLKRWSTNVALRHAQTESTDLGTQLNRGLDVVTGQWVGFHSAGRPVEHVPALQRVLAAGLGAWALAVPQGISSETQLEARLDSQAVEPENWMVDRTRIGQFPLRFAQATPGAEALLFARLSALFRPELLSTARALQVAAVSRSEAMVSQMTARPLRSIGTLLLKAPTTASARQALLKRLDALGLASAARQLIRIESKLSRAALKALNETSIP